MDAEEEVKPKSDSEEEDYENFFLQPASSPYNIAEKVEEANKALFSETYDISNREQKVRFRESLVDYEPDLTDDDVQSIESYNEIVDFSIAENLTEELKYVIQSDNEMYNIIEEVEDVDSDDVDEVPEEILDEVDTDGEVNDENIPDDDSIGEIQSISDEQSLETHEAQSNNNVEIKSSPKLIKLKRVQRTYPIECKMHCAEELDSRLDMCINNLYLNSKKPTCPPLKLQRRKCCENNKSEQKLPLYTGLRSEYGLSSSQIERQEKRKEVIRRKEEKRRDLQEEYRKRKIQQNEIIFCQWLRDISNRKLENQDAPKNKSCRSASSVNLDTRPRTASVKNSIYKRQRPHTTGTCIYIEISPDLLNAGFQVKDLYVRSKHITNKALHVLTLS